MRSGAKNIGWALVALVALVPSLVLANRADRPPTVRGLRVEPVVAGLDRPVHAAHAGDGSGRLFVVEKPGRIRIVRDGVLLPEPFLDITPLVRSDGNEQGLLSVAFHPDYAANGRFFVVYTAPNSDVVLAAYRVSPDPNRADPASGTPLLAVPKPFEDHNGGLARFGPDGYLYLGIGDGGASTAHQGNAQNLSLLLGKILRLDVDRVPPGQPYAVPRDNPFVGDPAVRPEIWAYGLRNPWRFAFDPATGDLFIADVGFHHFEEVDVQPAGAPAGRNYGWDWFEGRDCYTHEPRGCDPTGLVPPVVEYRQPGCSAIVGGEVYRGNAIPPLAGAYLYADFCSGRLWGLARDGDGWAVSGPVATGLTPTSFGVDEAGELYVTDIGGTLYRVTTFGRARS